MTIEERKLLLKDLCARLPYGVIFKSECDENLQEIHYIKDEEIYTRTYPHLPYWIETIKPYLRPMSSITEEEIEELNLISYKYENDIIENFGKENKRNIWAIWGLQYSEVEDYFNMHHIDYHGLIEKGLALEAPEGMYNV